jgi:chemotaxis protein methyltransferase CheR
MDVKISTEQLALLGDIVARNTGLHFPPSRWPDLSRAVVATARRINLDSAESCASLFTSLCATAGQWETLTSCLTVGETYFFRDSITFDVLAAEILPALVEKRKHDRRLRIWSAACCTGEEAYSIAILLQRMLPDWRDWDISILATDINPHFLRVAEAGIFGAWSFRDAPEWLQGQCFGTLAPGGPYEILPDIRRMVHFAPLNLATDPYPSTPELQEMDLIFCRNVLMYFVPTKVGKVIEKMSRLQKPGGWMVVGPSELLHLSAFPLAYRAVTFRGMAFYQKQQDPVGLSTTPAEPAALVDHTDTSSDGCAESPPIPGPVADPYTRATALYESGCYAETIQILSQAYRQRGFKSDELALMAHSLANQGQLDEALAHCDQWIAVDRLNADSHYLRAIVLQEQGRLEDALRSLRQVLHLDPRHAIAHYTVGNIARQRGHAVQANRHLTRALHLLRGFEPDDVVAKPIGMRARDLMEIVNHLLRMGTTA